MNFNNFGITIGRLVLMTFKRIVYEDR